VVAAQLDKYLLLYLGQLGQLVAFEASLRGMNGRQQLEVVHSSSMMLMAYHRNVALKELKEPRRPGSCSLLLIYKANFLSKQHLRKAFVNDIILVVQPTAFGVSVFQCQSIIKFRTLCMGDGNTDVLGAD